jgi:hypothetical protein
MIYVKTILIKIGEFIMAIMVLNPGIYEELNIQT